LMRLLVVLMLRRSMAKRYNHVVVGYKNIFEKTGM
jgi:hypothetical protein